MRSAVSRVEVDTEPDGSIVVSWAVEGEPTAVDVATGSTPDHLDHRHETTVDAGTTSLALAPREAPRVFVSVAPHGDGPAVVAADRRVAFEGIQNFRDLGGYHTRDGGVVRWGRVFRADGLHNLTERDLVRYHTLGLQTVFDLRGDAEREERPNPVPSHAHTVLSRPPDAPLASDMGSLTTPEDGEGVLQRLYLGVIEHSARSIADLYTTLTDERALPAVFHCHAGKDRTGMVAALLLELLGVTRETVLDDYELTSRYRLREHADTSFRRLVETGMAPEAAAGILTTPRWAMQHALEVLDEQYGGVETYVTGPGGMAPDVVGALRTTLLAPAPPR